MLNDRLFRTVLFLIAALALIALVLAALLYNCSLTCNL